MLQWKACGLKILVVIAVELLTCWSPLAHGIFAQSSNPLSVCDLVVDAGPDTNVCFPGGTVGLMGSLTGDPIFFLWTPAAGLSNQFILNPNANVNFPITYTLTGWAVDPNSPELIVNGDFSSGNVGFSSDYAYVVDIAGNQMEMYPEGTYTVINNPNLVHNGFSACPDHTTGTGNMMVINGAANLQDIWCQTVAIEPNTFYNVAAWVASVNPSSPAQLQFSINGTPIGNIVNAPPASCVWTPFNAVWTSGSNTSATICILNLNTAAGGNDFALDDISMIGLCSASDEVEITLYQEVAPEPVIDGPAFLCAGETGTYTATFPPEPPIYEYHWVVPGGAVILSGQGTEEVTVLWNNPQETSLCLNIETRCDVNSGCFDVEVGTIPELPAIFGGSSLCPGESTTLYTPEQDPDDTYEWSLPPNVNLISGGSTNEIEIEWASEGEVEICVAITNACGTNDNCTLLSLYPNYNVLFDTVICSGSTFFINGHEYGNGVLSGTEYMLSSHGCDSIVEVEVMEASVLTYFVSENLCPGDSVYAAGAYQTQGGIYTDSLFTASGCDSIIITEIIITPFDTTWLYATTCDSTQDGIFITSYANGNCDSTVIQQIDFVAPDTTYFVSASCSPVDTLFSIIHFSNHYGCDSVVITDVNLLRSDTTRLFYTSCDPSTVGVVTTKMTNSFGCDSTVIATTLFSLSDTTRIHRIVCTYVDTGTVTQLLMNNQGCDSLVINHAVFGGSDTTYFNANTCSAQAAGWVYDIRHNHVGCDSIVATFYALQSADFTTLYDTTCAEQDTGVYISVLQNQFGCDSTVTLKVALEDYNTCHLEYTFSVDTPRCEGNEIFMHIDLLAGEGPILLTAIHLDQVSEIQLDTLGNYDLPWFGYPQAHLIFTSANGLVRFDSIIVPYPYPLLIDVISSDDYNGYSVPCYGDHLGMAEVKVYQNGTPPLSFSWSSGQEDQALFNLEAGWYVATVTDSYGCQKRDSILLTAPPPLSFELTGKDLSCFGINDGQIQLTDISGGVPPVLNSIHGSSFSSDVFYTDLLAGEYQVTIQDKNGCTLSDDVTLTTPGPWSVALGPDTTIPYGSTLILNPSIFGTPQGMLQVEWSDAQCDNCISRSVTPLNPIDLTLTATDENGCTSEDDIRILVHIDRDLFIPNIFSPNGDNINDEFLISAGPALEEIALMTIYDRWGNVVFADDHFHANDPAHAWDGKMDGQLLNPGVFVYQLQAVFIDGKVADNYGSVTLVR